MASDLAARRHASSSPATTRQGAGDRRSARAIRHRGGVGGANSACPSRTRPETSFTENAQAQGGSRGKGLRPRRHLPTIPGLRSRRLAASPASIRRAGPETRRISGSPWQRVHELLAAKAPKTRAPISSARWRLPSPTARPKCSKARCSGRLSGRRAGRRGFGYDPIFVPDGYDETFGEMEPELKDAISHRARAFEQMMLAAYDDELSHSGSMCIGRSAWPNAPIATSTPMSAMAASTRATSLAAYLAELEHFASLAPGRTVTSIFFGGGTPSLMGREHGRSDPRRHRRSLDIGARRRDHARSQPTSVEAERFAGYRAAGVNRVSLGVQALDDASLKALGRMHTRR